MAESCRSLAETRRTASVAKETLAGHVGSDWLMIAAIDLPAGNGNMIASLRNPVVRHPNGLADSRRDADPRRIARRVVSIVFLGLDGRPKLPDGLENGPDLRRRRDAQGPMRCTPTPRRERRRSAGWDRPESPARYRQSRSVVLDRCSATARITSPVVSLRGKSTWGTGQPRNSHNGTHPSPMW